MKLLLLTINFLLLDFTKVEMHKIRTSLGKLAGAKASGLEISWQVCRCDLN